MRQTNWKYLHAAVWRKSVKGNVLNNIGQLCLERKTGTFRRNPRRTKLQLSTFEVTLPRDLRQKFIPQIGKNRNSTVSDTSPHPWHCVNVVTDTASCRRCYQVELFFVIMYLQFYIYIYIYIYSIIHILGFIIISELGIPF